MYEDGKKLGEIKIIEVFLKNNSQKKKSGGIKPVEININIKKTENDQAMVEVPSSIREKVVKRIIDTYKLNQSQIKITYSKRE